MLVLCLLRLEFLGRDLMSYPVDVLGQGEHFLFQRLLFVLVAHAGYLLSIDDAS